MLLNVSYVYLLCDDNNAQWKDTNVHFVSPLIPFSKIELEKKVLSFKSPRWKGKNPKAFRENKEQKVTEKGSRAVWPHFYDTKTEKYNKVISSQF